MKANPFLKEERETVDKLMEYRPGANRLPRTKGRRRPLLLSFHALCWYRSENVASENKTSGGERYLIKTASTELGQVTICSLCYGPRPRRRPSSSVHFIGSRRASSRPRVVLFSKCGGASRLVICGVVWFP